MNNQIGFIGYGNMGKALGEGLCNNGYSVFYYDLEQKENVSATYTSVERIVESCAYIILAIKPYQYEEFLEKHVLDNNIIISIAAGISSEFMDKYCEKYILTMPNTPALLNMGCSAIVKNNTISNDEYNNVKKFLSTVGDVIEINEDSLPLMISLTGSSPAYFFNFIDDLSNAISEKGIDKREAEIIFAKVMKASAQMILNSSESASVLTDNVCSPNGTTIQAINTFKKHDLEAICNEAITNCYNRAIEMKK